MNLRTDTLNPLARQTLRVVYELSYANQEVSARSVAVWLGTSPERVAKALRALDAAGLFWAERGRLTLQGLALAARQGVCARLARQGRLSTSHAA